MPYKVKTFTFFFIFCLLLQAGYGQETFELLFVKGDYDGILSKSSELNSSDAYYWHSLMLDRKGENLKSISFLKEGIEKYPQDTILEKQLADYYYKTGQYTQAKPMFYRYSDNPDVFLKLINVLGFEEDYRKGIELIKEKISTDSLNIELLSQLGDFYQQSGALSSSILIFEKLILINPNDLRSAIKLISLYIRTKDYMNAVERSDTYLKINPENIKLNTLKGMACFNMEDFHCAYPCFKVLLTKGDSSKFVFKHLGLIEFELGMFDASLEHLLEVFIKDDMDKETIYTLGKLYSRSDTPEEGLFYFNLVDSLMQPNPIILSNIYIEKQSIYYKLGNYEEALYCYLTAYSYDPQPQYLFFIASAYQTNLNDKRKALEYYEKFIAELPARPKSDSGKGKSTTTFTLKGAAENNIRRLKEELFFEGDKNIK
jgi:tetratricopeptide (TPR) repeat protein